MPVKVSPRSLLLVDKNIYTLNFKDLKRAKFRENFDGFIYRFAHC